MFEHERRFSYASLESSDFSDDEDEYLYAALQALQWLEDQKTPWQRLLEGGDDGEFAQTTGLPLAAFDALLDAGFRHRWETTVIPRSRRAGDQGQKRVRLDARVLDADAGLGLCLRYLVSNDTNTALREMFGLPATGLPRLATWLMLFFVTGSN